MERRVYYSEKVRILTADIKRFRKRNTAYVVSELAAFVLAIAGVAVYVSTETGYTFLYIAGLLLVSYVLIRRMDVRNSNRIEALQNTRRVYQKEQAYLDSDFSHFDDGTQYIDPGHPYTYDMDIFGHDSLFNRINRTITTGGSDKLASTLSCGFSRRERIVQHHAAIEELALREELRTRFLAHGQQGIINTSEILSALHGIEEKEYRFHLLPSILAIIATISVWLGIGLAIAGLIPASVVMIWVFLQFGIVFATNNAAFREATKVVNRMHRELRIYVGLITTIIESDLEAEECQHIIQTLTEQSALSSFTQLERILGGLDRQGNPFYRFLSDTFFCYDYWLIRQFRQWKVRYLVQIEDWIKSVSQFDALVSMATFRYNEPKTIDAEVIEASEVVYEAEGLSHPFLGKKAVSNDFTICDNHYYIITGANMAGKSTFLRTIGVNYIMAMCGMPVFAQRMKISVFSLFSSMRTTDDLTQGISYFNAELLRLQQMIRYCQQHPRTLIILDEILKGTNSLDKLNGSRLFLESIQHLPVTGIVATHDLELSKMEDLFPLRFHNYCFEIELSDHVTYTYKITPGVARNQNATFLLKNIVLKEELETN